MITVGIHGLAGSGKTTAAEYIRSKLNRCNITPFAQSIKTIAKSMGWNGKKDEKGRRLLQLLGTECGRQCISEDIWINKWREQVNFLANWDYIIADDVRFSNELKVIDLSIKISGRRYNLPDNQHSSEDRLANFYFTEIILNSGTIHYLEFRLDQFIEAHIPKEFLYVTT